MSGHAIGLHCRSISIFALWVTQLETSPQPRRFDEQSHSIRHSFLEQWDRFHLANHGLPAIYLDVLLSCISVDRDQVAEYPGSGQVAIAASMCLLRTLSGASPKSEVTEGIRQRYLEAIPHMAAFEGLPCRHAMYTIHALLNGSQERRPFDWADYKPCAREHVFFAATLVRVARTRPRGKVPRWALRFVIHSLSQEPPPPTSVTPDCLLVIARDLGCDASLLSYVNERCARYYASVNLSDV